MSSSWRQYCRDHAYGTYVDRDSENDWGSDKHFWDVSFPCGWRASFPTGTVHGGKPVSWPYTHDGYPWPYTRDGETIEHMAFLMHFHAHGKWRTDYVCDVCNDGIGYSLRRMMEHVEGYHSKAQLLNFFGYARHSTCVVS